MEKNSRIYVAGHTGLVGSALFKRLKELGHSPLGVRRFELDLLNQAQVEQFFKKEHIDYVFMAAGRVGGIKANMSFPCDFLYENAMMAMNVLSSAARHKVRKLVYLGSSCIYPNSYSEPITEDKLLQSPLEPSNEGYAVSKILGVKLCEFYQKQYRKNFVSIMPCNLYGENDHFDPEYSHVIPGMLRKFHQAKVKKELKVSLWGSGHPKREFLHADTAADGIIYAMDHYNDPTPINLGTGHDITIRELAEIIKDVVGYPGQVCFDSTNVADGTQRKVLNIDKMVNLGWKPKVIHLKEGLKEVYEVNKKKFT